MPRQSINGCTLCSDKVNGHSIVVVLADDKQNISHSSISGYVDDVPKMV